MRLVKSMLLLADLALASTANAAPTTFFGEDLSPGGNPANMTNSNAANASFLGQLSGVSVQTFESFSSGQGPPIVVSFGPDTATITGFSQIQGAPSVGQFAISPTHYLSTFSGLLLTFSTPQAAFGFYGTDIGDVSGQLRISLDGGAPINVPHTVSGPNGTGLFFGIIDTANPFLTVQFSTTSGSDAFGFDDFTIGRREQVVGTPEPASMLAWSLIGGMGLLTSRLRRRSFSRFV